MEPFAPGSVVIITLNHPREKYWGAVLAISPAGIAIRGIDLNSFDDFNRQVNAREPAAPHVVFFPMHRVERVEADLRNGEFPSMAERFEAKTARTTAQLFSGNFDASVASE